MNFSAKTALVTGSGSGIGRSSAPVASNTRSPRTCAALPSRV